MGMHVIFSVTLQYFVLLFHLSWEYELNGDRSICKISF